MSAAFKRALAAGAAPSQPVKRFKPAVKPMMPMYIQPSTRASRIERKFIDSTQAVAALGAAGIILVNGVATGTDYNNRIGRETAMKSIYLRLTGSNTVDQTAALRIMLVYDKQPNGVLPAITDVLTAADILSPNNLNNKDRFITLSDQDKQISTAGDRGFTHVVYKKVGLPCQFSGTGATIASISTGAVYIILIPILTSSGAVTGNFAVGYNVRTRFTDK